MAAFLELEKICVRLIRVEFVHRISFALEMGRIRAFFVSMVVAVAVNPAAANDDDSRPVLLAQRQSCKAVPSCYEAVVMWCQGYRRADGDDDGIPCENVCDNRQTVSQILIDIGPIAENSAICRPWLTR
jgi:hypothetical protein